METAKLHLGWGRLFSFHKKNFVLSIPSTAFSTFRWLSMHIQSLFYNRTVGTTLVYPLSIPKFCCSLPLSLATLSYPIISSWCFLYSPTAMAASLITIEGLLPSSWLIQTSGNRAKPMLKDEWRIKCIKCLLYCISSQGRRRDIKKGPQNWPDWCKKGHVFFFFFFFFNLVVGYAVEVQLVN